MKFELESTVKVIANKTGFKRWDELIGLIGKVESYYDSPIVDQPYEVRLENGICTTFSEDELESAE